jgi:hypothetical protein
MGRFVCIHGHFYQPPRENPWLEYVELQDSAYPYHDWNERITAEFYAPNATARLLGPEGRIEEIVNNYARISFNEDAVISPGSSSVIGCNDFLMVMCCYCLLRSLKRCSESENIHCAHEW